MENTKDVIFNVQYVGKKVGLRKKGFWRRTYEILYKNKFITSVVGLTVTLVVVDVIMLVYFIMGYMRGI